MFLLVPRFLLRGFGNGAPAPIQRLLQPASLSFILFVLVEYVAFGFETILRHFVLDVLLMPVSEKLPNNCRKLGVLVKRLRPFLFQLL